MIKDLLMVVEMALTAYFARANSWIAWYQI